MQEITLKGTVCHYWGGMTNIVVDGWVKVSLPYHLHDVREGTEVEITIKVTKEVEDDHPVKRSR